jgi:RNA polymerase sigma-70 factor (sigma-E family)
VDRKQARAFEGFVTESGDALLRMATLLTADPDAAEDVYQETLHRLAMRWSRVDSPRAFCRRVMHNIVIDQARARKRRPRELFAVHDRGDPRAGDPVAAAELRPALLAALGTLTLQQRTVVVLRYFDDLSENEVADLLGVSPGTVKSTPSRSRSCAPSPGSSPCSPATPPGKEHHARDRRGHRARAHAPLHR